MGPRAKAIANPMARPRRNRSNDTGDSEHADAPAMAGACRSPRGARRTPAHHTSRVGRFCSAMRAGSAVSGRLPQSESMAAECAVRVTGVSIGRQAGTSTSPSSPASVTAPLIVVPSRAASVPAATVQASGTETSTGCGREVEQHEDALRTMGPLEGDQAIGLAGGRRDRRHAPRCSAADARRSASSRRWRWSTDAGSPRCVSTLHVPASSTIGSHGSATEKPACGASLVHGIGERSGSRPATSTIRSGGHDRVRQAQLVAVVERRRAPQREQQHGRDRACAAPRRVATRDWS